jgi:hypothetical protein
MGTTFMERSMIDLTTGWVPHPGVPGGFHLVYIDSLVGEISIVTGPKGSGLMAANDPGLETTYEAWFPGMCDPTGYLILAELQGIIKFMRQREQERLAWQDED